MRRIEKVKSLSNNIKPLRLNTNKKTFAKQLSLQSFALILEYFLSQVTLSPDFESENYKKNLLEFDYQEHA